MPTTVDGLEVRRKLSPSRWGVPIPFGPDGWKLLCRLEKGSIIITTSPLPLGTDDTEYTHASVSFADRMPTYADLATLHRAVWGEQGWSYQVFAPKADHVNIHGTALHLWGRADGRPMMPNFGILGTI